MNAIHLLQKLKVYPIFGAKQVTSVLGCHKRYANLVLTRLHNTSAIKRIEHGKYTVCELAQTIATHLVKPSYITGWYSLKVYGLTEQLPQQIDVLTTKQKNKKIINFKNERIRYLTVDKKFLSGYYDEISEQYNMNIASKEKAIIDCLYFNLAPLSVIIQAIKESKAPLSKIANICLKLKNKKFLKKAGIIFASAGIDLYSNFKKYLDYNPLYLDKKICLLLDKSKFKVWDVKCQ